VTPKEQIEKLRRGVVDLHTAEDLEKKLSSGRPLRVKLGVDPTAPDLHLGHTVVLNKLRAFQDLGHVAILIIGDFTARVGDPSGRDRTRPLLSSAEIDANAKTFWEQASKILRPDTTKDLDNSDPEKTVVVHNSGWLTSFVSELGATGSSELFRTLAGLTVSRLLEREDFQTRLEAGHPITMLEFLYPVFQGYDSVAVRSDVELGGTDQLFNLMVGRDLQRRYADKMGWKADEPPQIALTLPLLVGTDGVKKMSKSYGNHIALKDAPKDIFGKTMSLSDETMWQYYELLTNEDLVESKKLHPMEAKKRLSALLVERFYGSGAGKAARDEFEKVFSKKELPSDMKESKVTPGMKIAEFIVSSGMAASKNEARRLIEQGGVRIDGQKVSDANLVVHGVVKDGGSVVTVGSRQARKAIKSE
jgi:tyrosyl-tRNA synthetase